MLLNKVQIKNPRNLKNLQKNMIILMIKIFQKLKTTLKIIINNLRKKKNFQKNMTTMKIKTIQKPNMKQKIIIKNIIKKYKKNLIILILKLLQKF